jgi:segregation and condensation protein B
VSGPCQLGLSRLTLRVKTLRPIEPLPLERIAILPRLGKFRRSLRDQLGRVSKGARAPLAGPDGGREPKSASWRRRLARGMPRTPGVAEAWVRDERDSRLEAVLFLAREPVNSRKLAQLAGLADGTEARTLIRRLNRWYDESGSAFRAEELAGGFQLLSRPKFGSWLGRLYRSPVEIRLSAPALETLAVVAYRQPVMRAEVEAIRGVDCGEILRQLMDRDLLRTAGRAHELGRPYWYATTKRFLQVFGLRHLDDLPRADLLRTPKTKSTSPAEPTHDIQSRTGGISEGLQSNACEDEEELERDHHRPS